MGKKFIAMGLLTWSAVACGTGMPTTATSPTAAVLSATAGAALPGTRALTFATLATDGAPIATYSQNGISLTTSSGDWKARTTYGNPLPFIQFWTEVGATTVGEVAITLDTPSYFHSIDLYSSTTVIPYTIKGLRNGADVFTLSGTVPNTFGAFHTVNNSQAQLVDALVVTLRNVSAGARNPMGLDTITFGTSPSTAPALWDVSGSVADASTGAMLAGADVRVTTPGQDYGRSAKTDSTGTFTLTGVEAGTVTFSGSATNYLASTQTVTLSSSQSLAFRLTKANNTPTTVPAPAGSTTIGFSGVANGAKISSVGESGVTIAASDAEWTGVTTYGNPAPFIQFYAEANTTVTGTINVTAGGAPFTFFSVDVYSSTTKIPYVLTGRRNGVVVFTTSAEQGNTFGGFRQVLNPNAIVPIDALTISLTNPAAIRNPVGLDNIVIVK